MIVANHGQYMYVLPHLVKKLNAVFSYRSKNLHSFFKKLPKTKQFLENKIPNFLMCQGMNLHKHFFLFLALYILIDYIICSEDMYLLQTGMTVSTLFTDMPSPCFLEITLNCSHQCLFSFYIFNQFNETVKI